MGEKKVRHDIRLSTLRKVEDFLKAQKTPISKSAIMRKTDVDYHSVKYALEMLKIKPDKDGKYSC